MKLLLAAAAGVLGYCYFRGSAARLPVRLPKEELHRWEGEGGNVPNVAAPSPAPNTLSPDPSLH